MQCYDCAVEERTTTAVVMCSTCGAGLCLDHAILGHADEWTATVGNPTAMRLPGRRFLCRTCATSGAQEEPAVASVVSAPGI